MRRIKSKRIVLYLAALALLLLGGRGTDIGRLRPVEVVRLYEQNGILVLDTDTGDVGWGLTVEQAVNKLKETTAGEIYLDTADFLLIEEGLGDYLPALRPYLKKKTGAVYATEKMDLKAAAGYLQVHHPSGTVENCQKPGEILSFEGGKILLKKFQEK